MVWYAFGDRAPSAKVSNDHELYALALDMNRLPHELRWLKKHSPRDYNHLVLVNEGRKLGKKQIAIANKVPGFYEIEL